MLKYQPTSKYPDNEAVDASKIRRLSLLTVLRLILASIMMFSLIWRFNMLPDSDGDKNAQPMIIAAIYTLAALIGWRVLATKVLVWRGVLFAQLMIDVIVISLLVASLGGSDGGYSVLYAIPIIAATMLLSRHLAFFIGAISFITLMLDALRRFIFLGQSVDWLLLGLYGLAFFVCISLLRLATERADHNEVLIRQARMSAVLVQEVQEQHLPEDSLAWLVFDNEGVVHLLNKGARSLAWQANVLLEIGYQITPSSPLLVWFNARDTLEEQVINWPPETLINPDDTMQQVSQNLYLKVSLLPQLSHMTALNLELASTRTSRQQQSQLAAMGRISASIAHEIRNPLGAISQAAELLQEGNGLTDADNQLVVLMLQNTYRINRIISNLLLWSKGVKTTPSLLLPNEYLATLVEQITHEITIPVDRIVFQALDFSQASVSQYSQYQIQFDTDHLYQIVHNLLSNALRYAQQENASIMVTLYPRGKHLGLCVIDNGEPVAKSITSNLFEPFQSTAKHGTGLGLYLSREYAVANQGALQLFEGLQLLRLLHWEGNTQLLDTAYTKTSWHTMAYTKAFVLSIPWSVKS
jgi:two-component system, NtrC family, sensor histidine kinase PilS